MLSIGRHSILLFPHSLRLEKFTKELWTCVVGSDCADIMPKIKRWFPVTHDINSDPEVWELRDRFGDRAGFVWLEMLSIADRNEGVVGPNNASIRAALAAKCRTSRAKVEALFGFARDKGWIELNPNIRVVKFAEYHRTRETNKNPPDPPDPPDHPDQNKKKKTARLPSPKMRARASLSL